MRFWATWLRQPQRLPARKAMVQVHLWTGLLLAIYVVLISLSGSVLVYRNELYRAFSPTPQNPTPLGFTATTWLLQFHANLWGGEIGRHANGIGAALVTLLGLTGIVVWWPGVQRWRRGLTVNLRGSSMQIIRRLHGALGVWCVAFILMWGITGLYLSFPQPFSELADYLEPFDPSQPIERVVDVVLFWLGYAHFGRFGGRIPGCGRGACNDVFKAIWAVIGLVPVILAATGVLMWGRRKA